MEKLKRLPAQGRIGWIDGSPPVFTALGHDAGGTTATCDGQALRKLREAKNLGAALWNAGRELSRVRDMVKAVDGGDALQLVRKPEIAATVRNAKLNASRCTEWMNTLLEKLTTAIFLVKRVHSILTAKPVLN